ncbi:NUDIX hydrolase [Vallitalea maricola]|uniref:Uncharacterized protein n=1 Tax=Vallitalea maricola TaxID=3074433 RepID=A0ACB5UJY8_9FIRM|nr:hypothetical protein AN2V17_21790 [Vallitalea sp. AN17-2]
MKVEFYNLDDFNNSLKFVVIQARYKDEWIFVRHKDRNTWEIPGGHIEKEEMPDEAAARELYEETGAIEYNLSPICNYSVEINESKSFGRLYYAEVKNIGELGDYEITEIITKDKLPEKLTYDKIQPILYKKVLASITI